MHLPPPALPSSHPRLSTAASAAEVRLAQQATPRPPTAVKAAQVGGKLVWLPVMDDDPSVSAVKSVEVPLETLRAPDGQLKPESPRVRIADSPYWVQENESNDGVYVRTPGANPFYQPSYPLPRESHAPAKHFIGMNALERATTKRTSPDAELTPWMAFENLDDAAKRVESLTGRKLPWGNDGQITVYLHAFSNSAAYCDPDTHAVLMGVVPVRDASTGKIFYEEMAASRDVELHEALGHGLIQGLLPNLWIHTTEAQPDMAMPYSESQGDLMAAWTSLLSPSRAQAVLEETGGDLRQSSAASRIAELVGKFGQAAGQPAVRDLVNHSKVRMHAAFNGPDADPHTVSEGISGALWDAFVDDVEAKQKAGMSPTTSVQSAAGDFIRLMVRVADFLPQNTFAPADLLKGYLAADGELFQSAQGDSLRRRLAERGVGPLLVPGRAVELPAPAVQAGPLPLTDAGWDDWLEQNRTALGTPEGFSLRLQKAEPGEDGRLRVRYQLVRGEGPAVEPLQNHGLLVFVDGQLKHAQPAFPRGVDPVRALSMLQSDAPPSPSDAAEGLTRYLHLKDDHPEVTLTRVYPRHAAGAVARAHPLEDSTAVGGAETLSGLPALK